MSTKSFIANFNHDLQRVVLDIGTNHGVTVELQTSESMIEAINRGLCSLNRTNEPVTVDRIADGLYNVTYTPIKPALATFADLARNEVPDTTAAAFLGIEADIFVIDLNSNFIHVSNVGERNYVVDIATTSGGLWEIPHHAMNEYWCGFTASLAPTDSVVFEIKSNGQHERLEATVNGTHSHIIDTRNVGA